MMGLRRKKIDIWLFITLIILAMYVIFLVFPLFTLLKSSIVDGEGNFSLDYFKRFFGKNYYLEALFNSLKITLSVTLATVIIGTPLAYIMSTFQIKGKGTIQILILISSMAPPFIGAYSWILLMGRNGTITKFASQLGISLPDIYGFKGIVLVLSLQLVPLIYMYLMGAMKNIDNSLLEASESLGCTGIRKVFKVVIPLVLPTLLAACLLVFMRALSDFGTPMLIGEGYRTVPVMIFTEFISEMGGDDGFAAAISMIVIVFATIVFLLQKYITNKKSFSMSALHPMESKKITGAKNILAHGYVYLFLIFATVPQMYVIYTAFLKTSGRIFIKGFSLDSFRIAFSRSGDAIKNTFTLAVIAICIIIFLAVLIAYVTVRRRSAVTNVLDVFTMLPYIIPGSVMGIALLLSFNQKPLFLSGTAAILIVAFVIKRLPYTVRSSSAIVHHTNPSIEEAAISLGASSIKTFRKITLPLMLSGVLSGAILSWTTIISELSSSILLYTAKNRTMTIAIYTEVSRGNYGTAAALSTILSFVTIMSLLLFFKVSGKKEITM